ncbi:hypothetical protein WICPIJ_001395 [Wickerhamomyces pijperi]|uniref:Uncharacterized protein n=1 Tax=Wickerhamomyces pijperi TaxID=599730 RepID=A0A9P8QBQ7_WICPI|nr:hypothetical protein WICPIJ_001395 [Wickerhamomyces pijperi]
MSPIRNFSCFDNVSSYWSNTEINWKVSPLVMTVLWYTTRIFNSSTNNKETYSVGKYGKPKRRSSLDIAGLTSPLDK